MGPINEYMLERLIHLAAIKTQMDDLKARDKLLRGQIQERLPEEGFKCSHGTVSWTHRKTVKYPDSVKHSINHIQTQAVESGLCEEVESVSMLIRL